MYHGATCSCCGSDLDPDQFNVKVHGYYICESCVEGGELDRIADLTDASIDITSAEADQR